MPFNPDLAAQIRHLLARHLPDGATLQDITEKRMFSSLAFMVKGKMCIAVSGRNGCEVMVRIGKDNHDQALTHDGVRTTVMGGRTYLGYIDLDETALPQLELWVALALQHNQTLFQQPQRTKNTTRRAKTPK